MSETTATRNPYDAHLCAQDPDGFQDGFDAARRAADAIATSTNRPWTETAELIGWPPTAYHQGLALAIYGLARG